MSYVTGATPQVVRSFPRNLDKDVDIRSSIKIEFSTDLDRDFIEANILVHDAKGLRIPGTFAYGSRLVTYTPDKPFSHLDTIRVTVIGDDMSGNNIGIRSVLGTRMKGNYAFSFTTAASPTLQAPVLIYPTDATAIRTNPKFDWKPVDGADHYQIQVSQQNTMNPVLWPPKWEEFKVFDAVADDRINLGEDGTYYVLREMIDPSMTFKDGLYYWRMRAVSPDGSFGDWTELHTFYIDTQEEGVVAEEDVVLPDIIEFDEVEDSPLEILAVFPEDGFSNVATNLKTVYVHVLGEFTKETFDGTFEIEGMPVDGDESDPSAIHGTVIGEIEVIPQGDGTTIIAFIMEPIETEVSG